MILGRILFDPEPAPGNGNNPPTPAPDAEKVTLKSILAKHSNDANAAMIELAPIFANMSRTVSALQAEVATLKAKVPADGSILVPADKAKLWEVVKDLADDPKEVARMLKEFPEVHKELAGIKDKARKDSLAQVARVGGKKVDPEVFAEFFGDLDYVVKAEKDKGSGVERQTLMVKHKDGGKDVETEFGEYVKKARPKLIPSLVVARSSTPEDVEDEDPDPEDTDEEIMRSTRRSRLPEYDPGDDGERAPLRGTKRAVNQLIGNNGGRYGQ